MKKVIVSTQVEHVYEVEDDFDKPEGWEDLAKDWALHDFNDGPDYCEVIYQEVMLVDA